LINPKNVLIWRAQRAVEDLVVAARRQRLQ
jgi:hypothetical protein